MKVLLYILFGGLTVAMALLAVGGFCTGYLNPENVEWVSFPGLILLPILAFNLLLFIGWSIARSHWRWVPLAALLLNINFIFSMFQLRIGTKTDVPKDKQIKLITYNVDNFFTEGKDQLLSIAEWAKKEDPDIICFQECPGESRLSMDSIARVFAFMPFYCSTRPASSGSGLAVFSRYPIRWSEPILYPGSGNKSLAVELDIQGMPVRLINNHLQTTSVNAVKPRLYQAHAEGNTQESTEAAFQMAFEMKRNFVMRAEQADYVRQIIGDNSKPILICGDFNDTPASYAYHRVKGDLTDGFRDCGSGFGYTFRQLKRMFRIDYIFYSSPFKGISYDSPSLTYSDHKPVVWVGYVN